MTAAIDEPQIESALITCIGEREAAMSQGQDWNAPTVTYRQPAFGQPAGQAQPGPQAQPAPQPQGQFPPQPGPAAPPQAPGYPQQPPQGYPSAQPAYPAGQQSYPP